LGDGSRWYRIGEWVRNHHLWMAPEKNSFTYLPINEKLETVQHVLLHSWSTISSTRPSTTSSWTSADAGWHASASALHRKWMKTLVIPAQGATQWLAPSGSLH